MNLSTSVSRIREVAISLKIGISGLEIEAKKEDYTITNVKSTIW